MGTTIYDMLQRTQRAKQYLPDQVETIVNQLADEILKLNTEGQLFKGVDNEGNNIGRYSRATQEITQGITGKGYPKKAGDPFNTYASGELWKSIDLAYKNNQPNIFSNNPNHPFFSKVPKEELLGLMPKHQEEFNYELLKPKIIEWLNKMLFSQ